MAPQPAPGTGTAPTGNALTDASGVTADPAQVAAALNTVNQQNANVASDCLWPPSGQVTVPIIPGLLHQSFQIPCLITYSEARALVGAGLVVMGLFAIWGGVEVIVGAAALDIGLHVIGMKFGKGKAGAAGKAEQQAAATKADMTEAA